MIQHLKFPRPTRIAFLRATLLNMALLDELLTGFEVVGIPLLRDQLGLSYEQVGLLFSVGALSGMILEPFLNLLSDRSSKRWWLIGGLLGLAIGFILAGTVRNFFLLLVAFALIYPSSGAAVGLSEAVLIDSAPEDGLRTMTRWTLMAGVGDLLSPLAVAAFVTLGLGWSALCWFAALIWLTAGLFVLPQRFPGPATSEEDEDAPATRSILANLRVALRDPHLLRWAALAILPTMLDEVFLGFAALYLRDVLHASQLVISICIVIHMLGAFPGLLLIERLIGRIAPQRLLLYLALTSLVGVIGFMSANSILLATVALFITSLGASGLYPIAQAQTYARQPGRSGTVRAIIGLGMPFEIALPGIVGLVADHFGLLAAIGLLGSAPLLIMLLAPRSDKK